MAEAITDALDQARLDPTSVDYINAHGSGTRQNDRHETAAFKRSLGEHAYEVPISSIKSMVGHSLGAIGVDRDGRLRAGHRARRGPADGELRAAATRSATSTTCRTMPGRYRCDVALSVGSGFGGFQSAMASRLHERWRQ